MRTTYTSRTIAGHRLHIIEFDPASFHEHDLLWLPHHAQLQTCANKRKTEHLAGRIAAVHALHEYGHKTVPGIGDRRQPRWPEGLSGSISHCATTALAVVSRQPVGVDVEAIFTPTLAAELESCIVTEAERRKLESSGLPVEQALTLAFSAKESAFKATPTSRQVNAGFMQYQIVDVQKNQMLLQSHARTYRVRWLFSGSRIITLAMRYTQNHSGCIEATSE
ncbi:enterobactin synthase subunit EntD [Citrobacter amalonaticus]|uniref:Enterobactin synthase component D n=1 Tax=Citrobacter amalonaticus TaxID=35703 RepID=A0A2S4S054_CITAM|nr:enterobactin synthase subunit EntD [Citrobacter amalonaticus]POT58264.1 enterobactin synthase subunit EntD [Citrobacter amalonaticus]POT76211.1 enterobactin synthase subunit EntD [Citrobacter amalonaticus]POU66790.1 enterobactin synthase subunit EntD [Citrobacter amalonaticus]POV05446.1 enterobactin synthase subunit EntD [Citrobacter amalonaticus]